MKRCNQETALMKAWILNSPWIYQEAERLGKSIIECLQAGDIKANEAYLQPSEAIDWEEVQDGIDAVSWI